MPSVLLIKITPAREGLKAPHVLYDPNVLADLNIGCSKSKDVFHIQKWKSCTVNNKSSKNGDLSNANTGL